MPNSDRTKIGIKAIEAMQPHSMLWYTMIPGFNVRRQNSPVVTFSIVYRTLEGTQRWHRLGRYGVWTPDQARREAQRVLRARDLGEDPAGARMALRTGMTVAQLCDEYSARENGKKPGTIRSDNSGIKLHIKPQLGKLKVATVTSEQVEDFMRSLSPGSAGRTIGLLGVMFNYAVKRKLMAVNPVRGVEKPKDVKRTRRLSEAEYAQLGSALKGGVLSDIFLFLAVTGFRSGEARNLRWSELDLERSIVTLGDTKTGVSVRPLSSAAIEIIQRQSRTNEYVFDYGHGRPVNSLRTYWLKLGMDKTVVPHVLRHSFASLAADLGLADSTIAGLIGHKQTYSQARRREHEASSNAMAREWNRVALAVARKTGHTVGLNASTRIAMDAKPVAQFRIQFFGVPTDRAPTILGEVDLLALDAVTAIRQAAHAAWPPSAIGFCLIDREGRAVFGRRKADRW